MKPIYFNPIYKERVWGDRFIERAFGRKLPEGKKIGESWEIVDRPEAQSVVESDDFGKLTIRELLEKNSDKVMGPDYKPNKAFPILVKWLDCNQRLSLQVHPPQEVATKLAGEPKTEHWYIADCRSDSSLLAGLKKGVSKEQFKQALKEHTLEELVCKLPAEKAAALFVESGRIHAIDAGNLILEIQQNSDTTYRVYDWGRVGLDGKARDLHIEESLESIDFEDFEPSLNYTKNDSVELANCKEFKIQKQVLKKGQTLNIAANEQARILSVVEGQLEDKGTESLVELSQNVLLPYVANFNFTATEDSVILLTENFS